MPPFTHGLQLAQGGTEFGHVRLQRRMAQAGQFGAQRAQFGGVGPQPRHALADAMQGARETLGIATLEAVKEKRAFGLWHLFNDTPLHVVAIERLAKWLHPERFAEIDPTATMAEAAAFSAIPLDGTLWIEP